jgi:4-hydroxy-tetrahydrodipicolinate synthase
MIYNNRATSGVDVSPELLVRMLRPSTTSQWSKPAGDLSRMQRIDQLSGGRRTLCNDSKPPGLDALQAGAAGWCTAAPCLRPQPFIDLYDAVPAGELPTAQAIYAEFKPLLEFNVAGGLATTVSADWERLGAGLGDPRRALLPLHDEGRATLKKLLTDA